MWSESALHAAWQRAAVRRKVLPFCIHVAATRTQIVRTPPPTHTHRLRSHFWSGTCCLPVRGYPASSRCTRTVPWVALAVVQQPHPQLEEEQGAHNVPHWLGVLAAAAVVRVGVLGTAVFVWFRRRRCPQWSACWYLDSPNWAGCTSECLFVC
jgi:hypothetical protein